MLCGARDTDEIKDEFASVVRGFGGEPWHYLSGSIHHLNAEGEGWDENSRGSVHRADLCVFVILRRRGARTWGVELQEAIRAGKPMRILCLGETYRRYLVSSRPGADSAGLGEDDAKLFELLRELEVSRQLTIIPFELDYFADELRRALGSLFSATLELLEVRNRRTSVLAGLKRDEPLDSTEIATLRALALDDSEDKEPRKRAIALLAHSGGMAEADVLDLLRSTEQGVQRITAGLLSQLCAGGSPADDFFSECVEVANESDDVGMARRLIPSLVGLDLDHALRAFDGLDLAEVGARRRLAAALEAAEPAIVERGLRRRAAALARRCATAEGSGWVSRCKELIARLEAIEQAGDE